MKKDKIINLLVIIIGILLVTILTVFLIKYFKKDNITDAQKFSSEYSKVDNTNVFVYKDINEIIQILEHGTGVVYLGFPECPWCQSYVEILNEVAKEVGVTKVYYFNILKDRQNNTEEYQKIVSILNENLLYNDEGNRRVFVPDITIVKDGKIIGHDNETSVVSKEDGTPEHYWTNDKKNALKIKLSNYMQEIVGNVCTSGCNE